MKAHFLSAVAAVAIITGATAAFPSLSPAQAAATGPGIVTSVGGSATISAECMSPGGEIWAEWYSLPPGKAVDESATGAKWGYVEMAFSGSAVVTGDPGPMCQFVNAGGLRGGNPEHVTDPGDMEVCNYAVLSGSRTENHGSEPHVFAGLAVGGLGRRGWRNQANYTSR
jgi:hypothetical protein